MKAETYNDSGFDLSLPSFSFDDHLVIHHGYMTKASLTGLRNEYPQFESIFLRLWQTYDDEAKKELAALLRAKNELASVSRPIPRWLFRRVRVPCAGSGSV
jgi:hypothetical protein